MTRPCNLQLAFLLFILGAAVVAADELELADNEEGSSPTTSPDYDDDNDLDFPHEEYTGEKEAEFGLLVQLDKSLNDKYRTILEECQFPDESELNNPDGLANQTIEYIFMRRRWLEFFKISPQKDSETFPLELDKLKIRERQLKEAEYILQSLKVLKIYKRNSKIHSILDQLSLKWGRGFDFAEGKNVSETALEYLDEFNSTLSELEESMDILEKQKVKDFPIVSCFNETIPPHYLEHALQIHERNQKVAPFYETAVTYGKIVEPILLALLTIFGLVWNCTLIYIFIFHKEIGNSKNLMILNLAVVAILRIVIELPLYYQQTYFSRQFLIDPSLFNAFRVFFISSCAFSIFGFIIRQFKPHSLYESPATKRKSNILYFLCVLTATVLTTAVFLCLVYKSDVYDVTDSILKFHISFFAVFGIIFPLVMAIMNFLIARRLIENSRETVNSEVHQHIKRMDKRGSRIGIALSIAYFVGCTPEFVRLIISHYLDVSSNEYNISYHFTDRALAYLFYSNVCMYPVALYIASGSYRRLFKLYLFRCLISKEQITSTDIVQM